MKPETAKRLLDAKHASEELEGFLSGHTWETFINDRGLQLITHKLLEIIGEALNGVRRSEPEVGVRVPNLQRFISLRNQITHGYDTVDYGILWTVSQEYVPDLALVVHQLLQEAPPPGQDRGK